MTKDDAKQRLDEIKETFRVGGFSDKVKEMLLREKEELEMFLNKLNC